MSKMVDGWEVVAIEPGLWCLRRPGYSAEIQASADGDNIDIADDAGRRWLYPPIAGIERLLALRRAALAPEDPLAVGVRSLVEGLDAIRAKALAPEAQAPSETIEGWTFEDDNGTVARAAGVALEVAGESGEFLVVASRGQCIIQLAVIDRLRAMWPARIDPRERAGHPVVVSERAGLARLLAWARGAEQEASSTAREIFATKPGSVRFHEGRQDAYADCVREVEREIAALGPPSIAEDLRAPESGAFEGAEIVGGDDQLEREIEALAREVAREDRNRAVWEALAELRGELEPNSSRLSAGLRFAIDALDRLAERFKP